MFMRLVKDDDVELMEEQDAHLPAPDDSQPDPESADALNAEQPDGAVDQPATEGPDDAADVQVDLRTLEALLFSTHHPLTAGRLAEMLDLESTKPLRRAIKELNE